MRLSAPSADELQWKAALAKTILDDVVESSSHEDKKVGRLLYSMSFLTVGAAIAFSSFIGNRIGIAVYGVDLVSVLFLLYIVFLVIGTTIVLEAMSPRLHLRGDPSSGDLESMHFFKSIARKTQTEWLSLFDDSSAGDLFARECDDTLRQAHFLSKKATEKIGYIRKAKWVMVFAAVTLVAMVAAEVLSYL